MMTKTKVAETSLVLTTGFLVLYFIIEKPFLLIVALLFGLIGIFIPILARYIAIAWFKLADVLNFVVSKVVLGSVFFFILFPISFLYKIAGKDKLNLRKSYESNWVERNKKYRRSDIENIW